MPLISALFKGDPVFEACLVKDSAHITPDARGFHVAKVQYALMALLRTALDAQEIKTGTYGKSTAAAVLAFKRARRIINTSYQNTADSIVGKMTIAALDAEMHRAEMRHGIGPTTSGLPFGFGAARGRP